MRFSKHYGFLALPRSYFSLTASPAIATLVSILVGVSELTNLTLLYLFFLFSTAFLNSYNNLMDARSDALTKDRFPIPLGLVTFSEALLFIGLAFTAAAVTATIISGVSNLAGYVAFTNLALAFLYSAPKIRLKRYPLVKGGVLVAHTLLFPYTTANLMLGQNPLNRISPLLPLLLVGLAVHTIQDIGDVEGDKVMGDKTLPIILGVKKSVLLSLTLLLASGGLLALYEAPYKAIGLGFIAIQIPLLFVLYVPEKIWKHVFWIISILSSGVVASILYGCCG